MTNFQNVHVAIATPCYGGQVFQNYLMSLIGLINDAHKSGLRLSFMIRGGDSLIPRTRNSIVAEFLAMDSFTHLLWIDADIGFSVEQIYRLIQVDRDVVAGIYPLKKIMWPAEGVPEGTTEQSFQANYAGFPFNPVGGGTTHIDEYGFCEVLDAPTGLMLIKKEVLHKMVRAYPGLQYVADEMPGLEDLKDKIANYHYRFFDVMTEENGRYLSEDYAFCRRWQNIGGKVYADVQSDLSHQGGHLYRGHLYNSLMTRHEKLLRQQEAAQAAASSVTPKIDDSTPPVDMKG